MDMMIVEAASEDYAQHQPASPLPFNKRQNQPQQSKDDDADDAANTSEVVEESSGNGLPKQDQQQLDHQNPTAEAPATPQNRTSNGEEERRTLNPFRMNDTSRSNTMHAESSNGRKRSASTTKPQHTFTTETVQEVEADVVASNPSKKQRPDEAKSEVNSSMTNNLPVKVESNCGQHKAGNEPKRKRGRRRKVRDNESGEGRLDGCGDSSQPTDGHALSSHDVMQPPTSPKNTRTGKKQTERFSLKRARREPRHTKDSTASEDTAKLSNGRTRARSSRNHPSTVSKEPTSPVVNITSEKRKRTPSRKAAETNAKRAPYKRTVKDTETEFSTMWICCECGEAECQMVTRADGEAEKVAVDELLICEGPCRRLFHYPCAGLTGLPPADEPYICRDCVRGDHPCAICQTYGKDNEDVFPCSAKGGCGLFFHEACLELRNIPVTLMQEPVSSSTMALKRGVENEVVEQQEGDGFILRRKFQCDAHNCWTCYQPDMARKENLAQTLSRKAKRKSLGPAKTAFTGNFQTKGVKDSLMRCLVCSRAYHITCFPPSTRFHELAMLCHEHASTHKLPELDHETSMQKTYEEVFNHKYSAETENGEKLRRNDTVAFGNLKNPFFFGVSGTKLTQKEESLHRKLSDSFFDESGMTFCLPCEIKDEVHAKPPSYKHVHTLQYNPSNRPTKIPRSADRCTCVETCDADCLNRMLYLECVGEQGSQSSNCAIGKGCGNRRLQKRQYPKCTIKREQGKGWGLITCENIKKGDLVTEYIGEVIDAREKEHRLIQWAEEHPNDVNFYVMSLQNQWYIDARHESNLSRFINHSCDPNCNLAGVNVNGYMRNGIYARRDIAEGEFLSYDYRFDTRQGDRFTCRCGSSNCRGTMKGKNVNFSVHSEVERATWEDAKRAYERDKTFLQEANQLRKKRLSLVDERVPAATQVDELVANGPNERYRRIAQQRRIFLWRNVVNGAEMASRLSQTA